MKHFISLAIGLLLIITGRSQTTRLDTTFAGKGWTTQSFDSYTRQLRPEAFTTLPDKSYSILGMLNGVPVLAKYLPDGQLDERFGNKGIKPITQPTDSNYINVYRYPYFQTFDTSFLIGGQLLDAPQPNNPTPDSHDFMFTRVFPDGTIDLNFGIGGRITTTEPDALDGQFSEVLVTADNKLVVAGRTLNSTNSFALSLLRLKADGTLDPSFGAGGRAIFPFNNFAYGRLSAIQVNPQGKLMVAGIGLKNDTGYYVVARFHPDGHPDTSFNHTGQINLAMPGNDITLNGIAVYPDGSTLISASHSPYYMNEYKVAFFRLHANGIPDSSFGVNGMISNIGNHLNDWPSSLVLLPNNKFIAGIYSPVSGALFGFTADGLPDSSFGENGQTILAQNAFAPGLYLSADKLMILGASEFTLARVETNGFYDSSFGNNGIVRTKTTFSNSFYELVTVQANGYPVVIGGAPRFGTSMAVARYTDKGITDTTFDKDGFLLASLSDQNRDPAFITVDANNKLLIGGSAINHATGFSEDFALLRYLPNGTRDVSFSGNGLLRLGTYATERAKAIHVLPDGSIIMIGYYLANFIGQVALVKISSSGGIDPSFGQNGWVRSSFSEIESIKDVIAATYDGKDGILVACWYELNGQTLTAVVRYRLDGSPDPQFGNNGLVKLKTDQPFKAHGIAAETTGKIYLGGTLGRENSMDQDFALMRLWPDGSVDTAYGVRGLARMDFGGSADVATTMAVLPDERAVLAGIRQISLHQQAGALILARFNDQGRPDTLFEDQGKLVTGFSCPVNSPLRSALAGNRLYLAGTKTNNFSDSSLLAAIDVDACTIRRYYQDQDGDGYGTRTVFTTSCTALPRYVKDSTDCDDRNANINPGTIEQADGIDNNCNGIVDEWGGIVRSFTLVDALTGKDLGTLGNDTIINLADIPGKSINIRANTYPEKVGQVLIALEGTKIYQRTEWNSPYALFINKGTQYTKWRPEEGLYKLTATPYESNKSKGQAGKPHSVSFTVIDKPQLKELTLIDARMDTVIGPVYPDMTIDLNKTPKITIRAEPASKAIGSVVFNIDGQMHIEHIGPYSMAGNRGSDYLPFETSYSTVRVAVFASSQRNGKGSMGHPHYVTLNFIRPQSSTLPKSQVNARQFALPDTEVLILEARPNPIQHDVQIMLQTTSATRVRLSLLDASGRRVSSLYSGTTQAKVPQQVQANLAGLPAGIYLLQLITENGSSKTVRVIKP